MAMPIQATPILKGKDAEIFLKEFEETNRLMQDPEYRKRIETYLDSCVKVYKHFESKRTPL